MFNLKINFVIHPTSEIYVSIKVTQQITIMLPNLMLRTIFQITRVRMVVRISEAITVKVTINLFKVCNVSIIKTLVLI